MSYSLLDDPRTEEEPCTFGGENSQTILLPCELIPNFDRNETIDLTGSKDRGKVTSEKPYPLWVNDDDDAGDLTGTDVPGSGNNNTDAVVNGARDLVDFAPLLLDIKQMLEVLPPSASIQYKLTQADGAVNFVYTDLAPGNVRDYLTTHPTTGYGTNFDKKPGEAASTQVTSSGLVLTQPFLDKITNEDKGIILIEGRAESTEPLVLQVHKDGSKIAECAFPLKITTVDKLFRHENLRPDSAGWPDNSSQEPDNLPNENTVAKYFLFLHGYNVSSESAKGWHAETFKRMYWAGSKARFVGVTWYGNQGQTSGVTPNYHINVINAQSQASALKGLVDSLKTDGTVYVAAHSMGNIVASTAITDHGAAFADYYLLNAAVAVEAYDGSQETEGMKHEDWRVDAGENDDDDYDSRLLASNWYQLFDSSDHRSKLTWRDRLADTKATRYFNFFSSSENVLGNHSGDAPSVEQTLWNEIMTALASAISGQASPDQGRFSWCFQEKTKGTNTNLIFTFIPDGENLPLGSRYGGWGFNRQDYGDPLGPHGSINSVWDADETQHLLTPSGLEGLKTTPFFFMGDSRMDALVGSGGSSEAQQNQSKYLAEMVPALSYASGANQIVKLTADSGEQRNFNMPDIYQNGWPSVRMGDLSWLHSDIKTIAYPYIYQFYDKMVELGELNQ